MKDAQTDRTNKFLKHGLYYFLSRCMDSKGKTEKEK